MITDGYVQYHEDLASLLAPIDEVHPHPDNYNNGDLDAIAESIEINGVYRPVFAQKSSHHLIAGNHVWEACKTLGAQEVPIIYLDVDDDTAYRIMVADNRTAELAQPDHALLLPILQRLAEHDSLLGTGYAQQDLLAIKALAEIPPDYDEHATWPLLTFRVPPHVRAAYWKITDIAVGDRERFEMLLRLAGWDGH